MFSADDEIDVITLFASGLGEEKRCIAGGYNDLILGYRVFSAMLGEMQIAQGIEKEIVGIIVGVSPGEFAVVGVADLFYIKGKGLDCGICV